MQPDPVSVGAMIELACVAVEGTPPLTYTWTRDSDGMEVFTNTSSGVYSLTVTSSDTYTCNITNPEGTSTTTVNIVLGIPPWPIRECELVLHFVIAYLLCNFSNSEPVCECGCR